MGRTYKKYHEEDQRPQKQVKHSNNHKQNDMRILNDHYYEDDDLHDDLELYHGFRNIINKYSE